MKFLSKCPNQVICMHPTRRQIVDGVPVVIPGKCIEFANGEYETTDKKEIDFLKKHKLNGPAITEVSEK
jgi:hypothetical protein